MVMVSPANDAFSTVLGMTSRALRNAATHGVVVEKRGDGFHLQLVKGHPTVDVITSADVGDPGQIAKQVGKFSDLIEVDGIPVFLLVHQPEDEKQYRSKWVLVDPHTLRPRETPRGFVEREFNRTS